VSVTIRYNRKLVHREGYRGINSDQTRHADRYGDEGRGFRGQPNSPTKEGDASELLNLVETPYRPTPLPFDLERRNSV